jgi:hypothetical protein
VVRVRVSLDQALVLEGVDDLAHRLRRHVRPPRALRVRQRLTVAVEDAERRVLERRQAVGTHPRRDSCADCALETGDRIADPRLYRRFELGHASRLAHLSNLVTGL